MERQLGSQMHDDSVRRRKCYLLVLIIRLQGCARIHWRLHIHVDAIERIKSSAQRRIVS